MTALNARLCDHLRRLYPEGDHSALASELIQAMGGPQPLSNITAPLWDQRDAVLISYGDSILTPGQTPLASLSRFIRRHLQHRFTTLHLLPYFPYSSDDGFAVMDYRQVNPSLGDWSDVATLARQMTLMTDLVLNHCSSRSRWFEQFKAGQAPGRDYFVTADPGEDLSQVVRPRTSPLLRAVQTPQGQRHVWCTFSPDQVDLNFANPALLIEMVKILRYYLDQGSRWIRLDAVAFLWKQPGSDCLNLPQTHEIIRLLRTLVEALAPDTVLITETNIPNRDNLSYFGNGNEAHLIYNFTLPPLVLHALLSGSSTALRRWQMSMPPTREGTAYLNFLASHDGIGLRPVEGLLSDRDIDAMANRMQAFGGKISWRSLSGQQPRPYEINISLFDACRGTLLQQDQWQMARFLCAHTLMLGLEGIPALYLHSLLATENDQQKLANTGNNRAINRHNWSTVELEAALIDPSSPRRQALEQLSQRLKLRQQQPAFHPNATQFTLHLGESLFGFWRQSRDRRQSIFAVHNLSHQPQSLCLADLNLIEPDCWRDLIGNQTLERTDASLTLAPYQCLWLTNQ
ncbi:alpha-amylase family glycosyl hydrolase [Ferrimonas sp. SCSIO 43195]|uniref:alpha-amylase family glycosyl hydrolase n=1 Tax=Ferrimonas sp. SCSIO 43195 TaxID=2822844 RepID=UPI002074E556|nr:alpha-amylase family glycosyl hydrolase [Ferrimonas sp. SCSIO 43195]USD36969.1 alpha-amylase [Ferrimonas sp. SCSIO 43195]